MSRAARFLQLGVTCINVGQSNADGAIKVQICRVQDSLLMDLLEKTKSRRYISELNMTYAKM
jgi:hypothetical protein